MLPSEQPGRCLGKTRRLPEYRSRAHDPHYTSGASILRCVGALLLGALATALLLMAIGRHYTPLHLSEAPTVGRAEQGVPGSHAIVFESAADIPEMPGHPALAASFGLQKSPVRHPTAVQLPQANSEPALAADGEDDGNLVLANTAMTGVSSSPTYP